MENYADNVENLATSSLFGGFFYFAYGKLFQKSCQELFENKSVSPFCTKSYKEKKRTRVLFFHIKKDPKESKLRKSSNACGKVYTASAARKNIGSRYTKKGRRVVNLYSQK